MEDYSKGWIDLGEADPKAVIIRAHELSVPAGMGFRHERKGLLTNDEVEPWLKELEERGKTRLDYVCGRGVKLSIHLHEGHCYIREGGWYDHTDEQLKRLVSRFTNTKIAPKEHGSFCECERCLPKAPNRDENTACDSGIQIQTF